MTSTWDQRVEQFWATADPSHPEAALNAIRALVSERDDGDPEALYEWASVHDYVGREHEAVPLYRTALERGLSGPRRPQAVIQLASSLRNIGEPQAAVDLLRKHRGDRSTGAANQAFLALALRDTGEHDQALRTALLALAPTLPLYRGAVENYANELTAAQVTRSRDAT